MTSMSAQLDCYAAIRALSAEMVDAARANDWDRLVSLESGVAVLRETLIAAADVAADATISAQDALRKRALIEQILADDAEVRRHVEPWMGHVRELLDGRTHRRQVQKAYAASDSGLGLDGGVA